MVGFDRSIEDLLELDLELDDRIDEDLVKFSRSDAVALSIELLRLSAVCRSSFNLRSARIISRDVRLSVSLSVRRFGAVSCFGRALICLSVSLVMNNDIKARSKIPVHFTRFLIAKYLLRVRLSFSLLPSFHDISG